MRPSGRSLSPSQRNESWEPEPLELPLVLPPSSRGVPGSRDSDDLDRQREIEREIEIGHEPDDDEAPARSGVIVIDLV
jgi:hypothetical protein